MSNENVLPRPKESSHPREMAVFFARSTHLIHIREAESKSRKSLDWLMRQDRSVILLLGLVLLLLSLLLLPLLLLLLFDPLLLLLLFDPF